jgi:hypothetical protein
MATATEPAAQTLTITQPDDWHLHVRDGAGMRAVVPHTARHFGRAVIMPNLVPPVTTTEMVSPLYFGFGLDRPLLHTYVEDCQWVLKIHVFAGAGFVCPV